MQLDPVQARVLGALIEKEIVTPETYPLSLNALVNACNQKSSRDPVMELTEADVRTALYDLENMGLARNVPGDRVSKYEHRVRDVLQLRRDEVAVLCLLLLRGPQTSGELRTRSERMFSFDDLDSVVATLNRMAARTKNEEPDPMVVLLPRQSGAREARYAHLLSGTPEITESATPASAGKRSEAMSEECQSRFAELQTQLEELKARIEALETGVNG